LLANLRVELNIRITTTFKIGQFFDGSFLFMLFIL